MSVTQMEGFIPSSFILLLQTATESHNLTSIEVQQVNTNKIILGIKKELYFLKCDIQDLLYDHVIIG